MWNKLISSAFCATLLMVGVGCKRPATVGTEEIYAGSDFAVTSQLNMFDKNMVNDVLPKFNIKNVANGNPLHFEAAFNQKVTWQIKIVGSVSGAYKIIRGTSDKIDSTNAKFQGDATSTQFFMYSSAIPALRDTMYASLYVNGIDTAVSKLKLIPKGILKNFNNHVRKGVTYHVIDDFENAGLATVVSAFSVDGADNGTPQTYIYKDSRVQGVGSLHMEGKDINNNGWLLSLNNPDLVEIGKNLTWADTALTADELYINLYIKGNGKPNSSVEVKMYEYDYASSRAVFNSTMTAYVYSPQEQAKNDGWIYDIVVDWEGWKLVSIPYSKFRVANDLNTGGAGNHIKQPARITAMAISLLSYPAAGMDVSADVDFVVLTEKGPFVPEY